MGKSADLAVVQQTVTVSSLLKKMAGYSLVSKQIDKVWWKEKVWLSQSIPGTNEQR